MSLNVTVTSSPSSSEVSNVDTTAPGTTLASSSIKSFELVIVITGASLAGVTLGSSDAGKPSTVPSFGVKV